MVKDSQIFLAVDGGGTKTTAWIADHTGKVLGKATTGPMSLAATSEQVASEHFLAAVEKAMQGVKVDRFTKVVVGLAGVDTDQEVEKAKDIFSQVLAQKVQFSDFEVVNDIVIALASGSSAPNAICLISGTGSNCFGRNSAGKTAKTGGMDYLLSDQGSGYDIGQQVLHAAVKSFDGRSKETLIEELVCEHFQIKSIEQLKNKVYHPLLNKTQIGELSAICFKAKEQHDMIANEIINQAVLSLMEMVLTVIRRLDLKQKPTDLVLVGGIATDPFVRDQLKARLNSNYSALQFITPEHPPVYGALQLALSSI